MENETEREVLETIAFGGEASFGPELAPDAVTLLKHGHHHHKPDQRRKRKHQKRKLKREASNA